MAELPGKGKQMPKGQTPSRLRNEVRPESTDDERDRKKHVTQVPDSDAVVPETQPDHNGYFNHNDCGPESEPDYTNIPTSPSAAAFLERTAVTKKAKTLECIPLTIKPRTKEPIGRIDSSELTVSTPFSFASTQARKIPSKTASNEVATTAETVIHTGLTTPISQEHNAQASRDVTAMAEPAYVSPLLLPGNEHHNEPSVTTNQEMDVFNQPVTEQSQNEPGYVLSMQADTVSVVPPSAQLNVRPTPGTSKVRGVKKGKKGRRGHFSQQREGPCPPRSRITPRYDHQAGTTGGEVPETFADPQRPSQVDTINERVHATQVHTVQAHIPTHDRYRHAYAQESHLPKEEHGCVSFDKESCNTTQSLVDTTSQDFPDSSAQREFPTSSMQVPPTLPPQPDVTEPEQQPLASVQDHVGGLYPEGHAVLSTQAPGPHALPNSQEPVDIPAVSTHSHQSEVRANNEQIASQPRDAEAVLHGISSRDVPRRVVKSRRKPRPSGPISHGLQEQATSPSVEHSFENLRVAMLANRYRAQHETKMTTKQHEAEIAELQRTIDNQIQTIAEHDRSHRNLREALSQLTDKAKTNQKFVTGLQQDYEKLQKSATNFQNQNKETLRAKITELENERQALQQEFDAITNKLVATQRKMKSALDDVYVRFVISESKRKNLAENLGKQDVVLKEERRKRDDMEKQLLSGVQSIPRQFVESSDALTKKLELLQTSLDKATAHDSRNGQIKECLDALQTLRLTPALTMQGIEKMKSTLRLVHERLDSGLDTFSETVKCKAPPDAELQNFIKEQLHGLQTEMLRYEEVTAENRKTHELNASLKAQLEAQQQHSNQLYEQVKGFQLAEIDLKARYDQLERDLNELRDVPHVDTSELELEALGLRQQLKKAEEDLEAANTKVEKVERERDTYKGYYEDVKTQLRELQQKPMFEDDTAIREKIAKDCASKFAEKEYSFKSEIHRLTIERDEKEKTLQELSNKLDAADTQLDELSEKIQTLESESVETTNLQEQLRKTTEELHTKDRDYAELSRQNEERTQKMLELQGLHDKLQAQAAQQQTAVQTMRREADSTIAKVRQDASNTLQLSRDQVSTLQEEKKNLSSRLEQVQMNEGKLQHEAAELPAAKAADVSRRQADADEENRKLVEQHRTEVDDWKRRESQKDAALKEVEAKLRVAEDQHRAKIATDREAAESNMLKLEQEYRDALRVAREQGSFNQQDGSQVQVAKKPLTELCETTQSAEPRKKVSRQNHSVLEVSQEQNHHSEKPSSTFHAEVSQTQLEDDDLFATQFEEQGEIDDILNDADGVDHEPGTATESQDIGSLSMTQDIFNDNLLRASRQELKHQASSSTDFSSISTNELTILEKTQPVSTDMLRGYDYGASNHGNPSYELSQTLEETQHVFPAVLRGYGRDPFNHGTSPTNAEVTSAVDNESVAGSQSSRSSGRPKSQANTASRMMPPPGNNSRYSRPGIGTHAADLGASTRHTTYGKANLKLGSSDSRHSKPSSSKQTYSQHDPQCSAQTGSQYGSSQDMKQDHTEKRKSSIDQTERDSATKKQRTKSQSRPLNCSPGLPSQSPHVSVSRPKAQKTMSYAQGSASTSSQSKTPVLSSRVCGRISRQAPSSGDAYSPRGQSSSQVPAGGPTRRSSTRLTRSKSRNGTAFGDGFNERFNEELD